MASHHVLPGADREAGLVWPPPPDRPGRIQESLSRRGGGDPASDTNPALDEGLDWSGEADPVRPATTPAHEPVAPAASRDPAPATAAQAEAPGSRGSVLLAFIAGLLLAVGGATIWKATGSAPAPMSVSARSSTDVPVVTVEPERGPVTGSIAPAAEVAQADFPVGGATPPTEPDSQTPVVESTTVLPVTPLPPPAVPASSAPITASPANARVTEQRPAALEARRPDLGGPPSSSRVPIPPSPAEAAPAAAIPAPIEVDEPVPAPPVAEPAAPSSEDTGVASASAPSSSADTVPAAQAPAPDTDQIVRVLQQFQLAYRQLDAGAAKRVWPTVDQRMLERAFASLSAQELAFARCDLSVTGTAADAACQGTMTYVPRVGSKDPRSVSREWTFELQKVADAWRITRAETR